jgi:hypothetical protein
MTVLEREGSSSCRARKYLPGAPSLAPDWLLRQHAMVAEDLPAGNLETLIESEVPGLPPCYADYLEQNRRLELLRLFIDFLISKRDRVLL